MVEGQGHDYPHVARGNDPRFIELMQLAKAEAMREINWWQYVAGQAQRTQGGSRD